MFMIYEDEMSQQNIINTIKAGLDLLHSKITMHELLLCELGLPSGTTYRTGENYVFKLTDKPKGY